MVCVNALKGATFISTEDIGIPGTVDEWMCQCPERGDLHFHLLSVPRNRRFFEKCVNALKGATFISTLASGNPHE